MRGFAISALTVREHDEAERWIEKWVEQTSHDKSLLIDALHHRAVLNRRRHQWLKVREDCLAIIEINPDYSNTAEILEIAMQEINKIAGENSSGEE